MDAANSVFTTDFDRVCELSKQHRYDYIIIGSGLGGGILASQLTDKKMNVLLIEKGGVTFSTHCLNTSRPHFQIGGVLGPSQDNDVVFNAHKAKVQTAAGSDPYVGGPVYCLGGRTTVWGLFAPEVDKATYQKYFPNKISEYLAGKGYSNAFDLFTNGSQKTTSRYPEGAIKTKELSTAKEDMTDALKEFYNAYYSAKSVPKVEIAPVATEFNSPRPYIFPQGAYSTVDSLLNKAYSRDSYLTVLLNTEALSISYGKAETAEFDHRASSVTVRTANGQRSGEIFAKQAGGVILCAGTIATAQIAFNSGLQKIHPLVGKGLTDHEIWGVRFVKDKNKPKKPSDEDKELIDALKLQSRVTVCGAPALLNVVVNANTFFGRSSSLFAPSTQWFDTEKKLKRGSSAGWANMDTGKCDTVNITLEFGAELYDESEVLNIPSSDPVIRVRRPAPRMSEKCQQEMQRLATSIRDHVLGINDTCEEQAPRLSLAGFGVVAHEVGTMRLQAPKSSAGYVVDDEYRVGGFSNLYVCDLSIFPISPPANPSLTLAALALQLAGKLAGEAQAQDADCEDSDDGLDVY